MYLGLKYIAFRINHSYDLVSNINVITFGSYVNKFALEQYCHVSWGRVRGA
jgi:hypothetical protein